MSSKITKRVPVTIVTGFLGAGKTSLLNNLVTASNGPRMAVLVNDFGAINIDADLIKSSDGEVISLENGCICCSLADGLLASAVRVLRLPEPPDRIVIETSGVSDPFEVARTFADPDLQPYAPLDGIVSVVDAEIGPTLTGPEGELARRQISAADIVLINKIDLVDDNGLKAATNWVRGISPKARLLKTVGAQVALELLMDIAGETAAARLTRNKTEGQSHRHSDVSPPFDSVVFESSVPIPLQRLQAALAALPVTVFRAKGLVYAAEKPDHRLILQATGRRAELTVGEPWDKVSRCNRLVFIGSKGGVDAQEISDLFGLAKIDV